MLTNMSSFKKIANDCSLNQYFRKISMKVKIVGLQHGQVANQWGQWQNLI